MANYLLLYHNSSLPEDESERREFISDWYRWMREVGNSVVDGGSATAEAKTVNKDTVQDLADDRVNGYSIVEAEDLDEAVELSKGLPIILEGGRVDVYKIFDT